MTSDLEDTIQNHYNWLYGKGGGKRADLSNTCLIGASIQDAILIQANLENSNFSNATLDNTNLAWTNLQKTNFSKASLRNVNFYNANLDFANFNGANLDGVNLKGAFIYRANFENTCVTAFTHDDYQVIFQRNTDETILYYGCEKHPISYWLRHIDSITAEHIEEDLVDTKINEILDLIEQHKVANSYENTTASKILF